jgi:hypothetical protein
MGQLPTQGRELPAPFGRYQLLRLLGQGGMGAVYLAHDNQLDRSVALKVPKLEAGDPSQVLARFYREAQAAAALRHPNICAVYDVGESDGIPYLTMAYIEGKPLSQAVPDGRSLSPRQAALLARKLALALQEAHRQGVIHRDLKPANVMIDRRGEPIVMDFGLARRARADAVRLTQSGTALGTPAYMPPEQVQGKLEEIGPGSDIYSLGVILYELLTGRLPFLASDALAMLSQVLLDEAPPPSRFRPDLDQELDAICLKAMAKKVEDRFSSMAELAAALQDFLRGSTQSAALQESVQTARLVPAACRSQPAGIQASQMGGLGSVAQLHAEVPVRTTHNGQPRASRRRKPRSRRLPWWAWLAGGGGLAGLLLVVGVLSSIAFRPAVPPASDSARSRPQADLAGRPASDAPNPPVGMAVGRIDLAPGGTGKTAPADGPLGSPNPLRQLLSVDLQPWANERLRDGEGARGNFNSLPDGKQLRGGIPFTINSGLIRVMGNRQGDGPARVNGIKVGAKLTRLYFLHGTHGAVGRDTVISWYVINYEDHSSRRLPIVYGRDIADYWYAADTAAPRDAVVAWTGTHPEAAKQGKRIRLYQSAWKNPYPQLQVESIDFISAGTACSPFCLAITMEQ